MKKISSIAAIFIIVFSMFPMLAPQVKATGDDSLSQSYFWQGHGGYVANGIGMWLQGGTSAGGEIIISGIPDGAIIEAAFLYWSTWEEINPPCTSITVNGIPITEEVIGTTTEIDPLWPVGRWPHTYRGYRADISSFATGNGIYKLSGFPTGTEYDRQNTMGATIVVIYSLPTAPLVTIVINDGMVALHARPQSYTTTLSGFVAPSSPVAQITYIAGQAEPHWNLDWEYFNGNLLAQNGLDGSDGPLWDTDNYDVSSHISEGDTSATVTITMQDDWIGWVAAVFEVKVAEEWWSFAIIADLHIGRGFPDYGGENCYLTERLEKVVEWINRNYNNVAIKFLVVLGDIADSAEYSELEKAKEILDHLEIPYVPIIGNHDVWSDGEANGDSYFNTIFDYDFFDSEFEKLGVDWWAKLEHMESPYLQNYAFSYGGITFIALDFVNRGESLIRSRAVLHDVTEYWIDECLDEGKPTVLLSHHPMISTFEDLPFEEDFEFLAFKDKDLETIAEIIERDKSNFGTKVLANFAGHIHGYFDPNKRFRVIDKSKHDLFRDVGAIWNSPIFVDANNYYQEEGFPTPAGIPVVTTEAMMVASNEPTPKSIVRIVKVKGGEVDFSTIDGEFRALNPYFKEVDTEEWRIVWGWLPKKKVVVEFEVYAFTKRFTEETPGTYILDFGDGMSDSKECKRWDKAVQFEHEYKERGKHYDVTLTVKGRTPGGEPIEESITQRIYVPPPRKNLFGVFSPADIAVTDPDGLVINKQKNEIPGATYVEADFNGDGDLDDIIVIPDRKIGDYLVTVTPEPDAAPTDIYTLLFWPETEEEPFVLAENVQISNIPSQPYIVRSTETEIIPIIPATVDFDPDTLNLKCKGRWVTVYIELPVGHGYYVSMINLESLWLNGQVQVEAKPIEIGDYDGDGIPDLMVKFNRTAVQNILNVGDKVEITISGKLIDGRLFEDKDTIKVILQP